MTRWGSPVDTHCFSPRLTVSTCKQNPVQISASPRKYVFDVTSVGHRSSPWTCNSVKVRIKFNLQCKLHFPSTQLMLRQMHFTNVSESIEAKYWVSWLSFDVQQAWILAIKTALNSSFCAATADSKSRWPDGKSVCLRCRREQCS